MTLNEYQEGARKTKGNQEDHRLALANWAMGLAGESGELVDLVKKVVFHDHPLDRDAVVKELGDVQWYLAILADELGITLEEIAARNLEKLSRRYEGGFSKAKSREREV